MKPMTESLPARASRAARAKSWLGARLGAPAIAWYAALLAVLLTAPSLASGLLLDDHVHHILFDDHLRLPGMPVSPIDGFVFVSRDPALRAQLLDRAHGPWWSSPDLVLAFFRPLSSLSHCVDYRLFPGQPALMHAENLVWLAALVLAAGALYRRVMASVWAAGLATVLFAVDDAHGLPAGWVANRNGLMAAAFGAWALVAHERWRRGGWRAGAIVGPLLFVLGLLSAEAGLATAGYLVAHAIFLERGSWRRRALGLAPYAVLTVVYRIIHHRLGYGTHGSGLYVDPAADPVRFTLGAVERIPVLLLGQLGFPSSDVAPLLVGPYRIAFALFAALFVAFVAWVLAPRLLRDPAARFWAAGMVLSVVPACATVPNDRLLLLPGLGAMALVAGLLHERWEPGISPQRRPARVLGFVWIALHVVMAPLLLPLRAVVPKYLANTIERQADSAPRDQGLRGKTLVMVNAPNVMVAMYVPIRIAVGEHPAPAYYRCLGSTFAAVTVSRPDARTLVLRPEGGYLASPMDGLVRSPDEPFHAGDVVRLSGLAIEVTRVTADGRPAEVTYRFEVPLEDPSLRWIAWQHTAFMAFVPPPVGGEAVLDETRMADMF
jgi:hypothetical protein